MNRYNVYLFYAGLNRIVEFARFDVLGYEAKLMQHMQTQSLVLGAQVAIFGRLWLWMASEKLIEHVGCHIALYIYS